MYVSRRSLLKGSAAGAAGLAFAGMRAPRAWAEDLPLPNVSATYTYPRPYPDLPAGQAMDDFPFDHIVVVMQENHSFDNYFGMLPKRGQPLADGFTFAPGTSTPINEVPHDQQWQRAFRLEGTCQPGGVTQAWIATHEQVNGGRMDGFSIEDPSLTTPAAMGYWDQSDLPFYYDLANHFTIGNRSFCATQGQTYPNRRFLYSGTALGMTSTTSDTFTLPYPAAGTIFENLATHGVSWMSYFTDLPTTAIIPQTIEKYPGNYGTFAQFLAQAAAGALPAVSFVDTEMGVLDEVGGELNTYLNDTASAVAPLSPAAQSAIAAANTEATGNIQDENGDEENPADIAIGEASVAAIVNAAMANQDAWQRTLIVLTYDEHGGYYDHVPPVAMAAPDSIPPVSTSPAYDGYASSGVRIPTIVVSPYSRANGVSSLVHDHTAILKTICTKWNLPSLTARDYAAPTLFDYVDFTKMQYATPPSLTAPAAPETALTCRTTPQDYVYSDDSTGAPPADLPETSLPVLLPAIGLGGAAALSVLTRRRHLAKRAAEAAEAEALERGETHLHDAT